MTFPLALLLWELARGNTWRAALGWQWPYWAMLALVVLLMFSNANYRTHMQTSADVNGLAGNLATQAIAIAYLLRQWFMPLWLNIDPDLHPAFTLAQAIPQLVLLALLCVMMLLTLRKRPWLGFALAWILLQLLPVHLLLPRLDVANDRQLYLLGWPLALALGAEMSLWMERRTCMLILVMLAFALGSLTVSRNLDYRSEIALWEDTVKKSPAKARVHNNLGYAYKLAERRDEARREFMRALDLDPAYYKARYNLLRMESGA